MTENEFEFEGMDA